MPRRKSTVPELKNAGEVPDVASQIRSDNPLSPLFVPPRYATEEADVETVLADTLEMLATVMTAGARSLREVLDRRYISVEEAVQIAAEQKKPNKRRPAKNVPTVSQEAVRAEFGRLVAMDYDRAVALLDMYSAMHFNEVKAPDYPAFYKAVQEELASERYQEAD